MLARALEPALRLLGVGARALEVALRVLGLFARALELRANLLDLTLHVAHVFLRRLLRLLELRARLRQVALRAAQLAAHVLELRSDAPERPGRRIGRRVGGLAQDAAAADRIERPLEQAVANPLQPRRLPQLAQRDHVRTLGDVEAPALAGVEPVADVDPKLLPRF